MGNYNKKIEYYGIAGIAEGSTQTVKANEKIMDKMNAFLRVGSVFLVLVLELFIIVGGAVLMQRSFVTLYFAMQLISVPLIYLMVNKEPRYKLNWVIIIFLLPGGGFLLYFLWGSKREYSRFNRTFRRIEHEIGEQIPIRHETEERCYTAYPNEAPIGRYLSRAGYPSFENEGVSFFKSGAQMLPVLLEDLKGAQKSIHIEMFILKRGSVWEEVFAVLKERAAAGVEVCLLLDDFGALNASTPSFRRSVRAAGIQLAFFAPIDKDVARVSFNFRTHQKYVLIDGEIGYCGGINLADEYFGREQRFGEWKDTCTRVCGAAVCSMEGSFLLMWQVCTGHALSLPPQKNGVAAAEPAFVRPFAGGPAKNPDNPVQAIYSMVIDRAANYLYITTPYLVLDRQMTLNLIRTAKSGVDVRIMMPGIYDKSYVHAVSRHNFGPLLKNGIRIFEYTPGFVHAKELVVDGNLAICGSVNLDFRSLWEHYECGTLFSGGQIVREIEADILEIQENSREISYEEWKHRSPLKKLTEMFLSLFSPLM